MPTLRRRGGFDAGGARPRPAPRFRNRRTRSWPCPSPARFSMLYTYDLHDIVLQLSGELDDASTPDFDQCADTAIAEHPRRLIVELSAVEALDGPGARALAGARDRAVSSDVEFVLDSPNARVETVLEQAGLRQTFFIR